jgi:hypothetical protein
MYNYSGINLNGSNGYLDLMSGFRLNKDADLLDVSNWNYHECRATKAFSEANTTINAVSSYYAHPGFVIFKNNYSSAIAARDNSNITFYNAARVQGRWVFTS